MLVDGYELVNEEKVNRAIEGTQTSKGETKGGVGESKNEDGELVNGPAILAEYDRLGGLIRLNGDRVKMGCFYDFKNKKPVENPEPLLEFIDVHGNKVVIPASEPLPPAVRAAKAAERGEVEVDEETEKTTSSLIGAGKKSKTKKTDEETVAE